MESEREEGLRERTRELEWIAADKGEAELLYAFVCLACAGRKGDVWSDYGTAWMFVMKPPPSKHPGSLGD
jgi:hypothetical protein